MVSEAVFGRDWTCVAHGDDCPKLGLDWDCTADPAEFEGAQMDGEN